MGVETPINELKEIPSRPKQGSLSVALTNASVLGRCYILHSQPAASVAVVLVPGTKRTEDKDTIPTNQGPACGWERRGDPDCCPEAIASSAKGYAAGGGAGALSQD